MDEKKDISETKKDYSLPVSIVFASILIFAGFIYSTGSGSVTDKNAVTKKTDTKDNVIVSATSEILWGDIGARMIEAGVIDNKKLTELYATKGGISDSDAQLLGSDKDKKLIIDKNNAGFALNLLWALGLGNKSPILEQGPMTDSRYGDPGQFASTGGWSLANGGTMNHYGKHSFISLTKEQWDMVERVSKNIYRPCCNNATYFPDCNHGMAMLGLLELVASRGVTEDQMYTVALQANALWFPNEYFVINKYLQSQDASLTTADPKEILGNNYSSASGYSRISTLVPKEQNSGGGSCGA